MRFVASFNIFCICITSEPLTAPCVQDLRLHTPHNITQWLQQAQPQPPSPVKNEPMSPRRAVENNYAAL